MAKYIAQREAFYELAVTNGIQSPEEIKAALPLGYSVPDVKLEKWLRKLRRVPKEFLPQKRYLNRFKLGADPEFCFATTALDGATIVQYPAMNLGMKQGPAFGADNNGRLAEIRPHPSRSAVEVTASILATLRWQALLVPKVTDFQWLSGAYLFGDGIGGHVHFGRKRPTRGEEIRALDGMSDLLNTIGVYPMREIQVRRRGDQRGQRYGLNGDYRLQTHGYEYRTWPSWLDSPELAFLTLVVSKLTVYNPSLVLKFNYAANMGIAQQIGFLNRLMNFLAYYKDTDDDAKLAYIMLQKRVPSHVGGDFKARWGLDKMAGLKTDVKFVPLSIPPSSEDTQEMFDYLLHGKKLEARVPKPTWGPTQPPAGYRLCIDQTQTILHKGMGELSWDLVVHEGANVMFDGSAQRLGQSMSISTALARLLPDDWRKRLELPPNSRPFDSKILEICISPDWREGARRQELRKKLLSGVFPIWRIQTVKENSYYEWKQGVIKLPSASKKFAGEILAQSREMFI